jgi:predicted nucleic acid-binding protein
VLDFLSARFHEPYLVLDPEQFRRLLDELRSHGISGGAAYDALIAFTAAEAGAQLVSCDRRAAETYRHLGVAVDVL